jgi:hypothetical protein
MNSKNQCAYIIKSATEKFKEWTSGVLTNSNERVQNLSGSGYTTKLELAFYDDFVSVNIWVHTPEEAKSFVVSHYYDGSHGFIDEFDSKFDNKIKIAEKYIDFIKSVNE